MIVFSVFVFIAIDLWDVDNPNLYTIKTVLKQDGEEIDEKTRIGFRTIEVSVDKGLLLNEKKIFINVVNR